MTVRHIENMNKIILATGSIVGYAYAMEFFMAWFSGNPYERFTFINRAFGPYAWAYWTMIFVMSSRRKLTRSRRFGRAH